MTEEAKELINCIRVNLRHNKCFGGIDEIGCKILLDCITNLQQEISDICKNRLAIAIERDRLQQENKKLKECYCNRTDCGGRIKDSKKYDSIYQEKEDYKSKCEKAIKYIKSTNCYGMRSGKTLLQKYLYELLNILNVSDKNE